MSISKGWLVLCLFLYSRFSYAWEFNVEVVKDSMQQAQTETNAVGAYIVAIIAGVLVVSLIVSIIRKA